MMKIVKNRAKRISMPDRYPDTDLTVRFSSKTCEDEKFQKAIDAEIQNISTRSDEGELYISGKGLEISKP